MDRGGGNAYTGTKASYVALSAVTVLALALLCSIWTTDVSGSVALLGLFAVYMASQELLVLFMVFIPASILVDLVRGLGGPPGTSGRGWLIFLQLLELVAKVAGGFFAFSLWQQQQQSVSAGEQLQASSYASPPPPPLHRSIPAASGGGSAATYQRVQDPFSSTPAYAPPHSSMSPVGSGSQVHMQQPPQQQQQPQLQQPQGVSSGGGVAPPPPPPPAAPHHDLV